MARHKAPKWAPSPVEAAVEKSPVEHDESDAFVFKAAHAKGGVVHVLDLQTDVTTYHAAPHLPAPALSHTDHVFDLGTLPIDEDGAGKGLRGGGGGGGHGGGKNKPAPAIPDPVDTTPDPEPTPAPTPTEPTPSPSPTLPAADYTSGLDTPDGFNIDLVFKGTWTDAMKIQAYAAAENISDIVTGDLPSYNGIDDLRVTLTSAAIDGAGGTWGRGGTDSVRSGSNLAATGHVTIDEADVANALKMGLMDDLLEHEIMHAMGFGTKWSAMGLVDDVNGDLRFTGANAIEAYNTLFAAIAVKDPLASVGVPIETDGGSGSAGKHWDEGTFGNELMTSSLNYNNDMSGLTIAALEDMGYQTTWGDQLLVA